MALKHRQDAFYDMYDDYDDYDVAGDDGYDSYGDYDDYTGHSGYGDQDYVQDTYSSSDRFGHSHEPTGYNNHHL